VSTIAPIAPLGIMSVAAPSGYRLRPFACNDSDYRANSALARAVFPEYPQTPEEMRFADEHRDPKCKFGQWVMETENGEMAGAVGWGQHPGAYHPRRFNIDYLVVYSEHRRRGVGGALFAQILADLAPHDPLTLRAYARENMTDGVEFFLKRGFVEEMRYWESRFAVAPFDPAPFAPDAARVAEGGVVIKTFAELEDQEGAENARRKLHRLTMELNQDVPQPDARTEIEYDVWAKRFDDPNWRADAAFVAVDAQTGEWSGFSNLTTSQADNDLHTGLTGVRRAWRRKGIALALKLRAIEYARAVGADNIRTGNETGNIGMLAINERLGFVRQPAWLDMARHFKTEETETTA